MMFDIHWVLVKSQLCLGNKGNNVLKKYSRLSMIYYFGFWASLEFWSFFGI